MSTESVLQMEGFYYSDLTKQLSWVLELHQKRLHSTDERAMNDDKGVLGTYCKCFYISQEIQDE
jgi:hypothetical protein